GERPRERAPLPAAPAPDRRPSVDWCALVRRTGPPARAPARRPRAPTLVSVRPWFPGRNAVRLKPKPVSAESAHGRFLDWRRQDRCRGRLAESPRVCELARRNVTKSENAFGKLTSAAIGEPRLMCGRTP